MNHIPLIIKREYLTKVRNKAFLVMTILSPFIMIILISVVAYLSELNNNKKRQISILDDSGMLASVFKNSEKTKYRILKNVTLDNAKTIVQENKNFGLLYIEKFSDISKASNHIQFYSKKPPSLSLISSLESKIEKQLYTLKLLEEGVDIKKIESAKIDVNINQENFVGKKTSKLESFMKLGFGGLAGYLLFMFIIIYGNMIMRSVIEEKTSRIIEVIISSVKPIQLMLGKIIGTSLAGVTQFLIWIFLGSILLSVVPFLLGIDITSTQAPQQELVQKAIENPRFNEEIQQIIHSFFNLPLYNLVVAFILFFIGGYLLYSSLYAAIGSAVNNETDTQQFLLPIMMPLVLGVYVGMFTVVEDPHGIISTVFSFIPFTSPIVMLMRIPFGVPMWQQILSLILLLGTFIFTVWFAAKIYKVGILMYGKKPTYKEIIKWLKY